MLRRLQNYPHLLELAYHATYRMLKPFRRWLVPGGRVEGFMGTLERWTKGAIFDCRMCGQCVLHTTGMTCPVTCPKNMRNGPCGGVLANGNCEILPHMPCVWLQAWERSRRMPQHGEEILALQAPLNHSLKGTSAWINDLKPNPPFTPKGWQG